jgi:hypothetical protein
VAFVAGGNEFTASTWIADSGASTHIGNVDEGLIDEVIINDPVKVGNGNQVRAIKKGTLPLMLLQKNGKTLDIPLEDYKYAPEFDVCLFSLMKAIEKGWTLSNEGIVGHVCHAYGSCEPLIQSPYSFFSFFCS